MMAEGGKGRADTGRWDFSLRACILLTAVVVCVGAFVSLFLFEATRRWQRHRVRVQFERAARDRVSALKREIDADLLILQALVRFYAGSNKVERDEFRTFVAGFLTSHPHIQALEWVPRVRDSQRAAYEAAARKDGYGNFQITERAKQGHMVRAPRRQEYFPVCFVEPYKGNEIALGFDLASSPTRLEAINRSRDTGKVAATARITLVQETGRQFGLLVFLPVYKKGAPTDSVDDRRENLEGFVLGVFRVGDFVERALASLSSIGVDVHISDQSAPAGRQFLYFPAARTSGLAVSPAAEEPDGMQAGLHMVAELEVGGRKWQALCRATEAFVAGRITWQPQGILAGGLLITALVTTYLFKVMSHAAQTHRLARRIFRANQQLEKEIAERERAEAALREAKAAAEQANRAKSEFLANMSHEIRTPLTAILGYADLAMDPDQTLCERREALAAIRSNGRHLLAVVNDILDISKIEAGKLVLAPGRCCVPAVVADVMSMLRVRADERGLWLSAEYAGQLPETILADEVRLRQMLVNLVGNGIKFTEAGGVRVVTTFLADWRRRQPAVRMEVIDTGVGIGPDEVRRLCEPFVQADGSASRRYGGTGLGLAITRRLAEMMGGELTVASEPGKGSTFGITIPTGPLEGVGMLDSPDEAVKGRKAAAKPQGPTPNCLAGVRILLAEDGPDNQRLIRSVLRKAGAEVTLAENGRIAVERALSGRFDLILMDMQMPEMDGYQATRELCEQGVSVPIIALTAHGMSGDREKCLSAGCADYLAKPISRRQLIETVMQHTGRQSPGGGQEATARRPDQARQVLQSEFDDDAGLAEVLDQFVADLPGQIEQMRAALANGCFQELRRLAHQIKGAGGSYGYAALSEAAKPLENAAKASDTEAATLAMKELAELARSIVAGRRRNSKEGAGR